MIKTSIFSSLGRRPVEPMAWCSVRRPSVCQLVHENIFFSRTN